MEGSGWKEGGSVSEHPCFAFFAPRRLRGGGRLGRTQGVFQPSVDIPGRTIFRLFRRSGFLSGTPYFACFAFFAPWRSPMTSLARRAPAVWTGEASLASVSRCEESEQSEIGPNNAFPLRWTLRVRARAIGRTDRKHERSCASQGGPSQRPRFQSRLRKKRIRRKKPLEARRGSR